MAFLDMSTEILKYEKMFVEGIPLLRGVRGVFFKKVTSVFLKLRGQRCF